DLLGLGEHRRPAPNGLPPVPAALPLGLQARGALDRADLVIAAVLPGLGRIPEVDHGVRRIVVPNRQVVVAGAATATTAATPPAAAGGGRVGSALRGLLLRGLRGLLALLPLLRRLLFLPGRGLLLLVLVLRLGVGLLASLGSGVVAALLGGVTTSATAAAPPAPTPPTPVRAAALRSPRLLLGGAPGLGGRLFRLGLRSRLQLM